MRKRSGLVAVLLAGAAAGCGADGLDARALAQRADAICAKYAERGRALGDLDFEDPQQAREYFDAAAALARRQQAELARLDPAADVAARYERLLAADRRAVALLDDLSTVGSEVTRAELAERIGPVAAAVDDAAGAVGAEECAGAG